ncbi:serine/threonine-protein kinase [Sporomusa sp. KB1]|jgi:serine/threonine protein kinase|uniref:serine/threonine-protein kinase n=1 Tax=Sporomusa sp. KB1 TaxID=943346 RepID=UPI0011A994F0|nr:serine/threonine-protein kinase [Sporomusa sp. KB1]TWH48286.1 protein kinase-like protein [Sporomusa sp. KB1]
MQYFAEDFDPQEYDSLTDLSGNENVTLMCHNETKKLIVRKIISGINKELYKQLVHVRHKNLVQVMGLEETTSNCYTYEEYINGETLAEILAKGPIQEEKAVHWIRQLCEAVRLLHEQSPSIIHRDIKPDNIMLSSDGVIKLIDFDASKEFTPNKQRDTQLVGTPNYAAPEQYGFASSDPRTDVYAMGILFHELITGYKPNEINFSYKGRYGKIIQKCIELDPKKRYQSVQELERQLGVHEVTGLIEHIPGFRTGTWWKKEIALGAYIIIAVFMTASVCSEWNLHGNIVKSLAVLGCWVILFVPPYILITNFLRLREKLPLLRSKFIIVKVFGAVLYLLLWLLLFSSTTSIERRL